MTAWSSALRLGSTSYVYPADVLPNVRRLAGTVQDVEWVVFEVTYGLPGPEVVDEMAHLARQYGHSYTVHLPLDLALAAEDEAARLAAVETARRVIAAARPLAPWAYVLHLLPGPEAAADRRVSPGWTECALRSLQELGAEAGGPERLAVENVPEYPPHCLWPLLERLPVSLCLDVGHLLRQGRDPRPLFAALCDRVRTLHLHGCCAGRDHRTLAAMDQGWLLDLLRLCRLRRFCGVATIELFESEAFWESWELVEGLWRRVQEESLVGGG